MKVMMKAIRLPRLREGRAAPASPECAVPSLLITSRAWPLRLIGLEERLNGSQTASYVYLPQCRKPPCPSLPSEASNCRGQKKHAMKFRLNNREIKV
jgi:hypothetical protein